MKSPDVYATARDILNPVCRSLAMRRTKSGMLGYFKAVDDEFLVFWLQISQDGWKDITRSRNYFGAAIPESLAARDYL